MDGPTPPDEPPPAVAGLREVLERARGGDHSALPELRRALASRPDLVEYCGDLAAIAERAWVELAAGPNLAVAESLKLRLAGLRAELDGPRPTPLERLAVERVLISWLQVAYSDVMAAGPGDVSPAVAAFALERQDRAQKRHLAALAALATIRRLLPAGGPARPGPPRRRPPPTRLGPVRRPAASRSSRRTTPTRAPRPTARGDPVERSELGRRPGRVVKLTELRRGGGPSAWAFSSVSRTSSDSCHGDPGCLRGICIA